MDENGMGDLGEISRLIETGEIDVAKDRIQVYKEAHPSSWQIYSSESVVFLLERDFDKARESIFKGLQIDPSNYDLLYNLAYCYRLMDSPVLELVTCRKIVNGHPYFTDNSEILDRMACLEKQIIEAEGGEFPKMLAGIKNVVLIDDRYSEKVGAIAKLLHNYGINVDVIHEYVTDAFYKKDDLSKFIRKKLWFHDTPSAVEYLKYYKYDVVHILGNPELFKPCFMENDVDFVHGHPDEISIEWLLPQYTSKRLVYDHLAIIPSESVPKYSVIIPTRNRCAYLKRTLAFLSSFDNKNYEIFVLDSSDDAFVEENKQTVESHGVAQYAHYSPDIPVHSKLTDSLKRVTTDYIVPLADDDLVTEAGIVASISRLSADSSLYSLKGKNLFYVDSPCNLFEYDWFDGALEEFPLDRIENISKGFVPSLIFQVFRADQFKKMYYFYENNRSELPQTEIFQEYLYYFMVLATGKLDRINVDLNVRDKGARRVRAVKNFDDAVNNDTFNSEFERFSGFIRKYLIYIDGLPNGFEERMGLVMDNFLKNFLAIPAEFIQRNGLVYEMSKLKQGVQLSWICK